VPQLNADNIRIDGNTISSTDTNGDITLDPNGTGDTIIASGNLGIGDSTPIALLTAVAADGVMADQYVAKFINSEATTGQNYGVFVAGGSSSADESFGVRNFDSSATYFKVRGDGNVGINTASPPATLTVSHTSGVDGRGIRLVNSSNSQAYETRIGVEGIENTSYAIKDMSNDAVRFLIDTSGRVSIGTTTAHTADSLLTIQNSSGSAELNITSGTSGGSVLNMGDTGDFNIGRIKYDQSSNSMQFNTNNAQRMHLASNGKVTISSYGTGNHAKWDFDGGYGATSNIAVAGNSTRLSLQAAGVQIGAIFCTATTTQFATSSDHRLKENVADMTGAIDRVKTLAPKRFNFIADTDTTVDGFLAHEAQAVVPEAVTGTHNEVETWTQQQIDDGDAPDGTSAGDNKLDGDGNTIPVMQGIDQSKLVPLLTAALKESIAKIETLETKVAALEAGS
jgi:hypothetical protein